ncbi:MAG TPA: efflux RND transporter periplasmic adaptor subunit [Methyloceanibacter sp.]|nr:efflux RND transporter periplasmic adaptor subunit [Methyloceanibacter sp.]
MERWTLNKSYLTAVILTLGIAAWVLGGYFFQSSGKETPDAPAVADAVASMTVAVRTQDAKPVEQFIVAQGQAEPNRTVTIRAETMGQVAEILADEGAVVAAGDVIVRLEANDRQARIDRAEARVREQQSAFEASETLGKKGYQSQRQADQIFSSLQTAKAELEQARIELEHIDIKAPFEGVVLSSPVELGTYVDVNGEVSTIVDNDPLVVSLRITQQNISNIKVGQAAFLKFATGQERDGKIRYIAARADEGTRTFRVEVELPNPNGEIPSGISAEAKIPTGSVMAHFVSPAALSLNDEGKLGVKMVNEDNRVVFNTASIVMSDVNNAWITGLPAHARIITLGHGFVQIGEEVQVAEEEGNAGPDGSREAAALLPASSTRDPTAKR